MHTFTKPPTSKFISMSGTVVTKIDGDPQETLTFNDESFLAFIPDKESLFMNFYFQNVQMEMRIGRIGLRWKK